MLALLLGAGLSGLAGPSAQAQIPAARPAAAAPSLADNAEILAATRLFSAWLESQMAYRGTPGVTVGVVHDQNLIWSKGFGFADVEKQIPMTADTKFRMASHSKMLTAIAIMQLREEGKLRLDDPVVKHLPWFKARPAGADDGPITIEQLLSHSTGLQREAGDHWVTFNFPTSAELVTLTPGRQAAFAPQVRWKYSNYAYALAGAIVEKASGKRYADYVQAAILGPLSMQDSSFDTPVPGLATPYGRRLPDGSRETYPFIDARGMASATGLTSTLADMAKYVSAQFRSGPRGGAQIASSGSLREMHRVRSVEEDWSGGSGLGFATRRINNKSYIGHGGGYPGYTTQTLFQLGDKTGFIVLTNAADSDVGAITQQLVASVGPVVAKVASAQPGAKVQWDPAWARFQGLYRNRGSDLAVVLMDNGLVVLPSTASGIDGAVKLEPTGNGRFRFDAPTGGSAAGEAVWFQEESGKPTRMYIGDGWSDKVEAP